MRAMVLYYDGNANRIADITFEGDPRSLKCENVAPDCEAINGIVEIQRGVDYDKEGYDLSTTNSDFPIMVVK